MSDNILSKTPGEFLGSTSNGLPDAATSEEATQRVICNYLTVRAMK